MTIQPNKPIVIVCEGQSEVAYLNEINRYMRENELRYVFLPRNACGGHYPEVIKKYKEEYKKNRSQRIEIWVDKDIYIRNDQNTQDKYDKKPDNVPAFKFNYLNFEDFLIMHLDRDIVTKWTSVCVAKDHFKSPMTGEKCCQLVDEHVFPEYQKGSLPDSFSITEEGLNNLFQHHHDISANVPFFSDFVDFLKDILNK